MIVRFFFVYLRIILKKLTKDNNLYRMSKSLSPALEVGLQEPFCLELEDCYSGNVKNPEDSFTKEMWDTVNPATGPVAIRGAKPGDILKIDLLKMTSRHYAVMCLEHGSGPLGGLIEGVETSILPIRDENLIFNDTLSVPCDIMLGVIGTAPAGESVLNGTPGEHGGNMDCKLIKEGSSLYLPVNVDCALLCAGDMHALMGDGEVCICGAETGGEIVLTTALENRPLPTPCVETDSHFSFIGSGHTLDECQKVVLNKAHTFLTQIELMSANDAARIMSLLGDLAVCQVVNPLKTMRFSLPKDIQRFLG